MTDTLESLRAERDQARQIVRDIHWMARRYADGRRSYAVSMFNDAVRPAFEQGWLVWNMAEQEPQYARDGDFDVEWTGLEQRLAAAEDNLAAAHVRGREEGAADMQKRAAGCAAQWQSPSAIRLAAGEMTAQELRTAQAVAGGIERAIRALPTASGEPASKASGGGDA